MSCLWNERVQLHLKTNFRLVIGRSLSIDFWTTHSSIPTTNNIRHLSCELSYHFYLMIENISLLLSYTTRLHLKNVLCEHYYSQHFSESTGSNWFLCDLHIHETLERNLSFIFIVLLLIKNRWCEIQRHNRRYNFIQL